ncbi:MAG: HAD-IA family hydrolase [Candidatus Latescibacteria bacterium]|nr:HAD-IA family hydrolase [Candidatus Latescibacterota bacterium]
MPVARGRRRLRFFCDVGFMKPEPAIYHLACEHLQVSPTETLFVGDGGSDEFQGAAAVGMQPIQAKWYLSRQIE